MKFILAALLLVVGCAPKNTPQHVAVSADRKGFVLVPSNKPFVPRGFNYDRDCKMRLIEDYWANEWPVIEQDFAEMRAMGANVVRVHLQYAKFMDSPERTNPTSLNRLRRLVILAEQNDLRLDITGLACYRKGDVPAWYNNLTETQRWKAQERFWEAIAMTCADRSGVFCYDLMNEPVVPAEKVPPRQWLVPFELAGFSYVQHIALDPAGRDRMKIASDWTSRMVDAIRRGDTRHCITLGLLPISADLAQTLAPQLDFISVHIYPDHGKIDEALRTLRSFEMGKPIVIEEIFPMNTTMPELAEFLARARPIAAGYIGFYWGQTPAELQSSQSIGDQQTRAWLEWFSQPQETSGD